MKAKGKAILRLFNKIILCGLVLKKIGKLFGKDRSNIQRLIAKIYKEQELEENSTCAFFAQVQKEGKTDCFECLK